MCGATPVKKVSNGEFQPLLTNDGSQESTPVSLGSWSGHGRFPRAWPMVRRSLEHVPWIGCHLILSVAPMHVVSDEVIQNIDGSCKFTT